MTKEWLKYRITILELYKDQGKTLDEVRTIMKEITITGSASDAQAVTTTEYLIQTWPTGGQIMKLIEDVASQPQHHSVVCKCSPKDIRGHPWNFIA